MSYSSVNLQKIQLEDNLRCPSACAKWEDFWLFLPGAGLAIQNYTHLKASLLLAEESSGAITQDMMVAAMGPGSSSY